MLFHLCYIQIVFLVFDVKQQFCYDLCVHFYQKKIEQQIQRSTAMPVKGSALFHIIVKLGFTGEYIFFFFKFLLELLQNIDCGYSLESLKAVLTCTHDLCFEEK